MTSSTQRHGRNGRRLIPILAVCASLGWIAQVSAAGATQPAATRAAATSLRLASDVWPPFTDVTSKPRFSIELVDEALKRAGAKTTTEVVAWGEVTRRLEAKKIDGCAAIWHSPERAKYLLFSEPYLENRLVIVGLKGADVSAKSFAELEGKRVALVAGYAYGAGIDEAEGPIRVEGKSDQESLDSLLAGDADYMLVDDLVVRHAFSRQPEKAAAKFVVGEHALARKPLHFAVHKDVLGAAELLERFDAAVAEMRRDGSYHRILGLRWLRADVDGDGLLEHVLRGLGGGAGPPRTSYTIDVTADGPLTTKNERVWIDGEVYEDWSVVPRKFKGPDKKFDDPIANTVVLLKF